MVDMITHVLDSTALMNELLEDYPELVSDPNDESGQGRKFHVDKTPTIRK